MRHFLLFSPIRLPFWAALFARVFLLGALVLGIGQLSAQAQEPAETQNAEELPAEEPETEAISELRQALYKAVNKTRSSVGARPVYRDSGFESVVRAHARDMVERTYMAHRSPEGEGPRERVLARFPDFLGIAGENIAMRTHRPGESAADTAQAAVEAWMDSPPHRKNLLDQRHGFAGISAADNGRAIYIVMLLTSEPSLRPPEPDPIPQPRPDADPTADTPDTEQTTGQLPTDRPTTDGPIGGPTGAPMRGPASRDPQLPENRRGNAQESAVSPAPGA